MKIIDQAFKFIIDNIIPDYLKYEFCIYSQNPKYKYSQVEKVKKITKYLLNEKKEQGDYSLFDDFMRCVDFSEDQYKKYQLKMPELAELRESYSLSIKTLIESRN